MPAREEDLPSTLERSPAKVKRTYQETLDSAHETYEGDEQRAHRAAWSAVKHVAEKRGDHWELKDEMGPSDPQAARSGAAARRSSGKTYGGVDASRSRSELYAEAREASIEGRSKMDKGELADALRKHNDRATARARRKR
jgi:cation transport regulator ChaB